MTTPFEGVLVDDPDLDSILNPVQGLLGEDYLPYRNHAFRVFNLAVLHASATGNDRRKLAIASAFHDLAIWHDGTWDYIQGSVTMAAKHLASTRHKDWIVDITLMISEHHKIMKYMGPSAHLVNSFRKADWLDVMMFKLPTRIPKDYLELLLTSFPRLGFHKRLWDMGWAWAKHHPFKPFPMLKL